ncbi:hypothetical protein NQ318_009336 [Aromia moschata]|uniref:Uncharacterized protein n=1 Tax=Aromia moschata TaxID=1265417 RepID=A0AAV8XN02_9CUCU|nr:hypothetical protein NQ318_009336 [Aromia moschata]
MGLDDTFIYDLLYNGVPNSMLTMEFRLLLLSTFPMFQQFGLVFREKFEELGISETQTTTVINFNSAFNAGMGGFLENLGNVGNEESEHFHQEKQLEQIYQGF